MYGECTEEERSIRIKILKTCCFFGYSKNMKYTKEYIREKIDAAIAENPDSRYVFITLTTECPTHEYIISYDTNTRTVHAVVEKIGKHKKVPRTLSDILRN